MMHGRFRNRCTAVVLLAAVGALWTYQTAPASVAYNGTRGLIRTRSADTFNKGTLSFQLSTNRNGISGQRPAMRTASSKPFSG